MKIKQHGFCSPEAMELRHRDGTPSWSVHVSELDSLGPVDKVMPTTFRAEVERVAAIRRALEADE